MADILDFPSRAKPRVTEEDFLFGGEGSPSNVTPYGETLEDFAPRPHFGLKPATGASLFNVRKEDVDAQERIKRAAREARNVFDAGHVCPSLLRAKAGHADGIAQSLRSLAAEVKALGAIKQGNTFETAADYVEMASAELEASFIPPEGA